MRQYNKYKTHMAFLLEYVGLLKLQKRIFSYQVWQLFKTCTVYNITLYCMALENAFHKFEKYSMVVKICAKCWGQLYLHFYNLLLGKTTVVKGYTKVSCWYLQTKFLHKMKACRLLGLCTVQMNKVIFM